jgi:hypothetical protein
MSAHVWMHHPVTGNFARLPVDAAEAWSELGWKVADEAPVDPDPALVEHQPRHVPAALEASPEPEPEPTGPATTTDNEEMR